MGENGVALMMTLWIMTLLIVLAMSFSYYTREETLSVRNFKEETSAYYAALSAYEEVLHYLYTDQDPQVDYVDEDGVFRTDGIREGVSGKKVVDGMELTVNLSDEESRINLNTVSPGVFRRALQNAGIPDDGISGMVDSFLDWKDPDDAQHLMGAESDYYESLPAPYDAKNANLDSVDELLLIKGFKREYLYGTDGTRPLADLFTVYGTGINVNTVSKKTMETLGVDPLFAEQVVGERETAGGLRSVPPSLLPYGINLTVSSHLRIEVWARPLASRQAVKITAVVEKANSTDGLVLKTRYWREGFESGRA